MKRLAFLVVLVLGCSYRSRERVISAADASDPAKTKLTSYLSAPLRPGQPSEQTWGAVPRAAVEDEAYLTKLDDDAVCVHLVERTHDGLDAPLSDWKFVLNGATVRVEHELVAVYDFRFTGEREALVGEPVTKEALAEVKLAAPAEKVFRVYERSGDLCGPRSPTRDQVLEVELSPEDGKGSWGARYAWRIR